MHILLWILQGLTALLYTASGTMKLFMFEKISADVPSFGGLPPGVWKALGVLELVCVIGLLLPAMMPAAWRFTSLAASALVLESLLFIWVHRNYDERGTMVMCAVLGLIMAFIAWGRWSFSTTT